MSSDGDERPTSAVDDGRSMTNRLQIQAAHPLHHHENHPLAFINSLDTLHRHFMISLQEFSGDPSASTLLFRSTGFFHCAACSTGSTGSGPSFHCLTCPFSVSAACAALPLVAVDHHPHPLLLLDRNADHHKHLICAGCDEGISSPSFVRCVHCDAFLHVQCALPPVIKADCHPHPIVLSSCKNGDGDCSENLCGVCGEEGDGVSWVYWCQICPFFAHVSCVIYHHHQVPSEKEASKALENDEHLEEEEEEDPHHEDEGIISHEISILKPGVTLQQILDSFSEAEGAEYQTLITAMVNEGGGNDDDDDEDEAENQSNSEDNHFSYLEKPLYALLDRLELDTDATNPFEGFDRDTPTVLVGGQYLILEKYVETFTKVFAKRGDISVSSILGIKAKTIVWNLFCKVIDDMSRTEFENTTGERLVSWMIGIRTIQLAGFEVGFEFEVWNKIARAFFGVKAKEVSEEMVAETEEKIEQQRLKLEKLCEKRDQLLSFREKGLVEALTLEGKIAGDGLI